LCRKALVDRKDDTLYFIEDIYSRDRLLAEALFGRASEKNH
jgi:hypothetical protein